MRTPVPNHRWQATAGRHDGALSEVCERPLLLKLGAFIVYAASDFLSWRLAVVRSARESFEEFKAGMRQDNESEGVSAAREDRYRWAEEDFRRQQSRNRYAYSLSSPVSVLRGLFEFVLPVVVGSYALLVLWSG